MQQGIYIPASIMRKFNLIPQTHPQQHSLVPAGIIMGIYMKYCSWKLWKTTDDNIFHADEGLQYHILDHSVKLCGKDIAIANQILQEFGLITLKFGAVTDVKIFHPGRRFQ